MSSDGSSREGTPVLEQKQPDEQAEPSGLTDTVDDGTGLDTSFFPAPPSLWKRYTSSNLSLPPDAVVEGTGEALPTCTRAQLDPPNVDWITAQGSYSVFGQTWPVEEHLPNLQEMGVVQMFDPAQGESARGLVSEIGGSCFNGRTI